MGDGHGHNHSHRHHHGNETRTLIAAALTGAFMVVEIIGGLVFGSLALLADAAHMSTDALSLTAAWAAFRISHKPPDKRRSYGYHRVQILVAFANGCALIIIALWVWVEAVRRLFEPQDVAGLGMLSVAALGLLVNIGAFVALHGADQGNLNVRAAFWHVLGDLLGSVAALTAAGIILLTGQTWVDPAASILLGALLVLAGIRVTKSAAHVLMEGTPAHLDPETVKADLLEHVSGISDVHHIHLWSLSSERPLITLHICLNADASAEQAVRDVKARLAQRFGITHTTVEPERGPCADGAAQAAAE
jgi:cobalt-zinc-cadmium efflux system protein